MSNTKIALKTFPDLVDQHKDLPVDYFEVAIRPTIFGKETSLDTQLEAYATIADKVIGIHGAIYREGVNLLDPNAKEMNQKADNEIIEIANPIWANLVKSSNMKDYGGFTKDFSSQMLYGANEVELGKQWASNDLEMRELMKRCSAQNKQSQSLIKKAQSQKDIKPSSKNFKRK